MTLKAFDENEGCELILTGHSLGGGTYLLANVFLHQEERTDGSKFRLEKAVNYIHEIDEVPQATQVAIFVRLLLSQPWTKDLARKTDTTNKAKILLGLGVEVPNAPVVDTVQKVLSSSTLVSKPGIRVPLMIAPVVAIACARETSDTKTYDIKLCVPTLLAKNRIFVDSGRFLTISYQLRIEHIFRILELRWLL